MFPKIGIRIFFTGMEYGPASEKRPNQIESTKKKENKYEQVK